MYRVLKGKGGTANVIVENTDTRANIIIGRVCLEITNTLTEAGYKTPGYLDEWNIEVNKETAVTLSQMAMKMRKPIRDQRKPETKKEANKQIDAMDVMLGLANYS